MKTDVPKIVLTGGPCAGKTTAISEMATWARETGYLPIIVPEAATFLMAAGLDPRDPNFQPAVLAHVVNTEASLEKYAQGMAEKGHNPVLICDRGLWDQSAPSSSIRMNPTPIATNLSQRRKTLMNVLRMLGPGFHISG